MTILDFLKTDSNGANAAMANLAKRVTPRSELAKVIEQVDPKGVGRSGIQVVDDELKLSRSALESVLSSVSLRRKKKIEDDWLID